jgi:hypothetical protein
VLLSPVITQLVAGVITVQVLAGERAAPLESSAVMVNEAGAPFVLVPSKDEVIEIVACPLPATALTVGTAGAFITQMAYKTTLE